MKRIKNWMQKQSAWTILGIVGGAFIVVGKINDIFADPISYWTLWGMLGVVIVGAIWHFSKIRW